MQQSIADFTGQKKIAVAGVSRNPRKFGSGACRELKKRGYKVFPMHPELESFDGEMVYSKVSDLPPDVTALFICVSPSYSADLVQQAGEHGIRHVWIQQGARHDEAVSRGRDLGINLIHGRCILMFAEPVTGGHSFHRFLVRLFGKYPN